MSDNFYIDNLILPLHLISCGYSYSEIHLLDASKENFDGEDVDFPSVPVVPAEEIQKFDSEGGSK